MSKSYTISGEVRVSLTIALQEIEVYTYGNPDPQPIILQEIASIFTSLHRQGTSFQGLSLEVQSATLTVPKGGE